MAHFAHIKNGFVSKVHVVNNSVITDGDGVEQEALGKQFLSELYGYALEDVIQCSYNANIRKNYAGIGYTYDADRDAFIPPAPYPSWVLDEETCLWEAPVPMPENGYYTWNESTQSWDAVSEA